MSALKSVQNQLGLTLVEISVTVGLLGIVLAGSMGTFEMMTKMSNANEAQVEMGGLVTQSNAILGGTNSCTNVMAGTLSVDDEDITISPTIDGNMDFGKYLHIDSIKVQNVAVAQGITRRADIMIRLSRDMASSVGSTNLTRTLPIYYSVDGNNRVVECIGPDIDLNNSCQQLGGVLDPNTFVCDFCAGLGGQRDNNGNCNIPNDPQTDCTNTGGVWDANTQTCDYCVLVGGVLNNGVCETPPNLQDVCQKFGGIWDPITQTCSIGDLPAACISFGGVWDANNSVCDFPRDPEQDCINLGGVWDVNANPQCTIGAGGGGGCVDVRQVASRRNGNIAMNMTASAGSALGTLLRTYPNTATQAEVDAARAKFATAMQDSVQNGPRGMWPGGESDTSWRTSGSSGPIKWSIGAHRSSLFRGDCPLRGRGPHNPPYCLQSSANAVVTLCVPP